MITFGFWFRLFVSALLSACMLWIPVYWFYLGITLKEKILFGLTGILFSIACVAAGISLFGLIWTF